MNLYQNINYQWNFTFCEVNTSEAKKVEFDVSNPEELKQISEMSDVSNSKDHNGENDMISKSESSNGKLNVTTTKNWVLVQNAALAIDVYGAKVRLGWVT